MGLEIKKHEDIKRIYCNYITMKNDQGEITKLEN